MEVEVLEEHGYQSSLLGLSRSFEGEPNGNVAKRLSHRQGGHNKFLESMMVWIDINAPRYWWQQFDTYRVGTTKQSGSTMHTLMRRSLRQSDFEGGCNAITLAMLNVGIKLKKFEWVKRHLPESFLQPRVVCTNYKTLQNMETQRRKHRLPEWQLFLNTVLDEVEFPEFIRKDTEGEVIR